LTGGSVVGWMRQYGTEYIDWQAQAPLSFSAAALLLLLLLLVMLQHGSSSVVSYRWSHECAGTLRVYGRRPDCTAQLRRYNHAGTSSFADTKVSQWV